MSDTAAVHEAEARLQTILKAVVVSAKTQDQASRPGGEDLSATEPPGVTLRSLRHRGRSDGGGVRSGRWLGRSDAVFETGRIA